MACSATVTIVNRKGLHARASSAFSTTSQNFASQVEVRHNGFEASGRSIMDLMMLAAGKGSQIVIQADGPDEDVVLKALVDLVESGFGEVD